MGAEQHKRFAWAPVAAKPGQDEKKRRLGAKLRSPTGEVISGHLVEAGQFRSRSAEWNWSVGIYRSAGVYFIRSGYAGATQEASDLANDAVSAIVAEAAAHDESEAALEALLNAARRPEGQWVIPTLPIPGRDERFLRRLQWLVGRGAKNSFGGLIWPGYITLAKALKEYLGS